MKIVTTKLLEDLFFFYLDFSAEPWQWLFFASGLLTRPFPVLRRSCRSRPGTCWWSRARSRAWPPPSLRPELRPASRTRYFLLLSRKTKRVPEEWERNSCERGLNNVAWIRPFAAHPSRKLYITDIYEFIAFCYFTHLWGQWPHDTYGRCSLPWHSWRHVFYVVGVLNKLNWYNFAYRDLFSAEKPVNAQGMSNNCVCVGNSKQ